MDPVVIKCPDSKCEGKNDNILCVQKTYEYWTMENGPNKNGNVDLKQMTESYIDADFKRYLMCECCGKLFNMNGTPRSK